MHLPSLAIDSRVIVVRLFEAGSQALAFSSVDRLVATFQIGIVHFKKAIGGVVGVFIFDNFSWLQCHHTTSTLTRRSRTCRDQQAPTCLSAPFDPTLPRLMLLAPRFIIQQLLLSRRIIVCRCRRRRSGHLNLDFFHRCTDRRRRLQSLRLCLLFLVRGAGSCCSWCCLHEKLVLLFIFTQLIIFLSEFNNATFKL